MDERIQRVIRKLHEGAPITGGEAEAAFDAVMDGKATDAQIGALLMGLAIRGESVDILAAAARAMRRAAVVIHPKTKGILDTCGTGGDAKGTFNISTTTAFVVAAAGVPVAKHGNRAISSKSGSADVLQALGVNLDLPPERVAACIDEVGIGFLFAPAHHPAMRYAIGPRRELGVRSIFNLLGPLTNPAGADYQLVGVYTEEKLGLMAETLRHLGVKRALVVHGDDGLDEVTTTTTSHAVLMEQGQHLQAFLIDPKAFGIPYADPAALKGGDAEENAAITRAILSGEKGAKRDIVLLNASCALLVAGKAASIPEGIAMAAEAIDSGAAMLVLERLIAFTREQA